LVIVGNFVTNTEIEVEADSNNCILSVGSTYYCGSTDTAIVFRSWLSLKKFRKLTINNSGAVTINRNFILAAQNAVDLAPGVTGKQ